jgi:hypothetical protein
MQGVSNRFKAEDLSRVSIPFDLRHSRLGIEQKIELLNVVFPFRDYLNGFSVYLDHFER